MEGKIPANASVRTTLRMATALRIKRQRQHEREMQAPIGHCVCPSSPNLGLETEQAQPVINYALYGNVESSQSGIKF